jgi:two-component system cell cycle response regulator
MSGSTRTFGRQGGDGAGTLLVPVADRVRYLNAYRLVAVTAAAVVWIILPSARALDLGRFCGLLLGYLALAMASRAIWRLPRAHAIRIFGLSLLLDGVFIACVSSSSDPSANPLRYLVFLHLITVALLASFRTGLKLAVWHSLLVSMDVQLRQSGFLGGFDNPVDGDGATRQSIVFVLAFGMVALTTASFSAVNERELRRRSLDLNALATLAWRLESRSDAAGSAEALVEAVANDFDIERIILLETGERDDPVLASAGVPIEAGRQHDPRSDALVEAAAAGRATLLVRSLDPAADPWLSAVLPNARNIGLVPLYAEAHTIGVLVFEYGLRQGSRIEHRVVTIIERFASQAALALANARLLDQIQTLATTDGLTGLLNRRSLDERLAREVARCETGGGPLTAILIDVDHFKQVNDVHGHAVGDEVLKAVARSVQSYARRGDTVARYGGEEIAVLLPDTGADEAPALAERIRAAIEACTEPLQVTASLGYGVVPLDATDARGVFEAADQALYVSKRQGRNRVTAYAALSKQPERLPA